MAIRLTLDQVIGVRIPGGQPKKSAATVCQTNGCGVFLYVCFFANVNQEASRNQ